LTSNDWWKAFSLFLWFYNTAATAMLLVYFYGICRLSERRFKGKAYTFLLPFFFVLMGASTLIYSLADSIVAIYLWYAVWPAVAGVILLIVVYRSYRLMLGR
jgi:prepilin signal peptidase PulO-like enzyme (type II secretory pathway)